MDAVGSCRRNFPVATCDKGDHKKLLGLTPSEDDQTSHDDLVSLFPEIDTYSFIAPLPLDELCSLEDMIEKYNAMLSRYMGIPFPEQMDEVTWAIKVRQLEWLLEAGHLPVKRKK